MRRRVTKQTSRENHPADSVSDYYKKAVTIPLLDQLNAELRCEYCSCPNGLYAFQK